MNVRISIKYLSSGGRTQQNGIFPLKGRKPEKVALEWIKQIKKEVYFEGLLEVIVDGKEDITEDVNKLLKAPLDE